MMKKRLEARDDVTNIKKGERKICGPTKEDLSIIVTWSKVSLTHM